MGGREGKGVNHGVEVGISGGGGERDQSEQNGNLGELLLVHSSIHPSTKSGMPGFTWIDLRESSL